MSREKSEKDVQNVPLAVRLNEEEHEKLKQCAAACGLSAAEFLRQLCKGNAPQSKPEKEFWELLSTLYEVHAAFKKCVPYFASAIEICKEIEDFILELQQKSTLPQRFSVEELTEQGAASTRLSLPPTLTKGICIIISVSTPFLILMGEI